MRNPWPCWGLRARRDNASSTQLLTEAPAVSAASSISVFSDGGTRNVILASRSSVDADCGGDGGFGDAQRRVAVGENEVDGAIGQLGADLDGGLLGKIHRRLSNRRAQGGDEMVEGLLDGDVAAGQGALRGECRLHRIDDRLNLHRLVPDESTAQRPRRRPSKRARSRRVRVIWRRRRTRSSWVAAMNCGFPKKGDIILSFL